MKQLKFNIKPKKIQSISILMLLISSFISSCTVTNNLYVNSPVPLSKGEYELYGGAGMGLQPKIDSVSDIGEVFSHSLQRSYNLIIGGRYGVTHLFSLGGNIHFPEIIGGFGISVRPQLSLLPNVTGFNLGIAADIGGTFSKDSITILGSSDYMDNQTRGVWTADLSLPMGLRLAKDVWFVATPRYSFNTFYLRREFEIEKSKKMKVQYPAISMGLRVKKLHLETTVAKLDTNYKFMAGIVVFLGSGNKWDID